jgi:hypothetical protein
MIQEQQASISRHFMSYLYLYESFGLGRLFRGCVEEGERRHIKMALQEAEGDSKGMGTRGT